MITKCPTCNQPLPIDPKVLAAVKRAATAAKRQAEWDASLPARQAAAEDDYLRMNYYQQSDWETDKFGNVVTPPPTVEQWSHMTKTQKVAVGSVRPEDLPKENP